MNEQINYSIRQIGKNGFNYVFVELINNLFA